MLLLRPLLFPDRRCSAAGQPFTAESPRTPSLRRGQFNVPLTIFPSILEFILM